MNYPSRLICFICKNVLFFSSFILSVKFRLLLHPCLTLCCFLFVCFFVFCFWLVPHFHPPSSVSSSLHSSVYHTGYFTVLGGFSSLYATLQIYFFSSINAHSLFHAIIWIKLLTAPFLPGSVFLGRLQAQRAAGS